MKKNIMMRLASILLIAVLMSTCAISGTFAKYATETGGTASARVAYWTFDVGGTDITEEEFTFNLCKTITEIGGGDETDVATGSSGEFLLAPGTQGSFNIVLENTSEVTAQYKVVFSTTGMPENFTYTYTVGNEVKDEDDEAVFTPIAMDEVVTIPVNWEWLFGDAASSDNQYQGTDLKINVTVIVEQLN